MPRSTTQLKSFATYHHNNGIIIQFVLFELIQAFEQVRQIDESLSGITLTPTKKLSKNDRELLNTIAHAISCLAGYSQEKMRIFTWNLSNGILAKIKAHGSLYANNIDPQNPDTDSLLRHADRAWIHCLDALEHIRAVQELPSNKSPDLSAIHTSLKKMFGRMRRLAKVIESSLDQFRTDENVLYFLLCKKESLDKIYNPDFVCKLFKKMYPKGINEIEKFLMQKYKARGFSHLIPVITQKLAELEPANV